MRIHIVCPSDEVNGSAESLHQFGRAAATLGYDVRIAYLPNPIGAAYTAYRHYGLIADPQLDDSAGVLAVAASSDLHLIEGLREAQPVAWWLRVETGSEKVRDARNLGTALHIVQSDHARQCLAAQGISAPVVGDFISDAFIERLASFTTTQRLDTVLFRRDPTDTVTPQLVEASRDVLSWVPIDGLAPAEVTEIMAYSKVYVDFGPHQGRTRMPREALIAGLCVVTGTRNAAGNDADASVPAPFRFVDESPTAVHDTLNRIALSLLEFDETQAALAPARAAVREERLAVAGQIEAFLESVRSEMQWRSALPGLASRRRRAMPAHAGHSPLRSSVVN